MSRKNSVVQAKISPQDLLAKQSHHLHFSFAEGRI